MPAVLLMFFVLMFIGEMEDTAYAAGYPTAVEGIDPTLLQAYFLSAQRADEITPGCDGMTWTLLAAVGWVETKHATYSSSDNGRDVNRSINSNGDVSPPIVGIALDGNNGTRAISDTDDGEYDGDTDWDRAVGPMQFIPESWKSYGQDGNGDGEKDPQNVFDATAATVDHLCKSGNRDLSSESGLKKAILGYNQSGEYYDAVIERKEHYDALGFGDLTLDPNAQCGGKPDRIPDYPAALGGPSPHVLHPDLCQIYVILGTTFGDKGIWQQSMTPGGNMGENQESYHCIRPGATLKHGDGQACDFYVGTHDKNASVSYPESHAMARQVINTLIMNNERFENLCIIYEQRIWWANRDPVGEWISVSSVMSDRGNLNENHYNHMHISVGDPNTC